MSRPHDAIAAIVELLDTSPTDVEAWSELSDLYSSLGLYSQAIYSLEEVLLVAPNAWNVGRSWHERSVNIAPLPSVQETDNALTRFKLVWESSYTCLLVLPQPTVQEAPR